MEFVAGLILGAVLGVAADRFWEKWEKRPRVAIRAGVFASIDQGSGLTLTVINTGTKDLPEFDVQIFHPLRGTLSAFWRGPAGNGPLLPGQQREFRCGLTDARQACPMFKNWFFNEGHQLVVQPQYGDFRFRLKMVSSDVILFESGELGNALARLWVKVLQNGDPLSATGEELSSLFYPKASRLRRWIKARRKPRTAPVSTQGSNPPG
jgi:hypothetical protein